MASEGGGGAPPKVATVSGLAAVHMLQVLTEAALLVVHTLHVHGPEARSAPHSSHTMPAVFSVVHMLHAHMVEAFAVAATAAALPPAPESVGGDRVEGCQWSHSSSSSSSWCVWCSLTKQCDMLLQQALKHRHILGCDRARGEWPKQHTRSCNVGAELRGG